ncbi:MAG: NERD domain-containing protein [Acholeplasmatales bacterium]|nr:NERD domain-containing protein [Acholeplasmatales bacterium]
MGTTIGIIIGVIFIVFIIAVIGVIARISQNNNSNDEYYEDNNKQVNTNKRIYGNLGNAGENEVFSILRRFKDVFIINGIILGSGNNTTEIDHIFICSKGVFVIETKRWIGKLSGYQNDDYWYFSPKGSDESLDFHSPYKQNEHHAQMLEKEAKIKSDYNIVVFIGTDISGVSCDNIYTIDEFEEILLDIMDDEAKANNPVAAITPNKILLFFIFFLLQSNISRELFDL